MSYSEWLPWIVGFVLLLILIYPYALKIREEEVTRLNQMNDTCISANMSLVGSLTHINDEDYVKCRTIIDGDLVEKWIKIKEVY